MKGDIETLVDAVISGRTSSTPKPTMNHTRRLFRKLPAPVATLLTIGAAAAMLSGLLFVAFQVNMTGIVTLTGTPKPLFAFDGQEFETAFLNLSQDLTELTAGETRTFSHSIENRDAGAWLVDFNLTSCQYFYTDPLDPYYGLNVSIENLELNGEPTTETTIVPGDLLTFDIVWTLHHEFVTPENPLESIIRITWTRTNAPPLAVADHTTMSCSQSQLLDVLANDLDPDHQPNELSIVSVTFNGGDPHVTATIEGNQVRLVSDGSYVGPSSFYYTITDGLEESTALIYINM